MRRFLESVLAPSRRDHAHIQRINALRAEFSRLADAELRAAATTNELLPLLAATAVIASRVLGLKMFDVQFRGALAPARERSPKCRPVRARRWRPCRPSCGLPRRTRAFTS